MYTIVKYSIWGFLVGDLLYHVKDRHKRDIPGRLLGFWNGGTNVRIWGLQFGVGKINWGLKFQGPKCAISGLKLGVGEEIIWSLIFLVPKRSIHVS